MRIKTYPNGGYSQGGFTSPGGTMTGPLILSGNPTDSLHAAPKQYVDSVLSNFSAAKFTTGVIQVSRLPALSGDAVAASGTNNITLISTGVTTGVYTKVTVNTKGLITTASGLLESDVPVLSWTKITTGKPTTLAGYGITDALPLSGGLINGDLTLHADPTSAMHLATKQYVDAKMLSASGAVTGDIYLVNNNAVPSGYLRLNGSDVSKTTYSALYAVVGDAFTTYNQPGSGQPWCQQYQFNDSSVTDVSLWSNAATLPGSVGYTQTVVTKNRVYVLGGTTNNATLTPMATVYTAPINSDGTLGTWATGTSLPVNLSHSQAIVTKNRVYLIGGLTTGQAEVSATYTAPINADGTIGTWTTGTSLPATVFNAKAIVTKNRVYLLGGRRGLTYLNQVYTAPIDTGGVIGAWSSGTALPTANASSHIAVTRNRVYLIGGIDGSNYVSTVYTAPINTDGTLGVWSSSTPIPSPVGAGSVFVTKKAVILFDGVQLTGACAAPINPDGTLGTWVVKPALNWTYSYGYFITSSRIYLIGGASSGNNGSVSTLVGTFSGGLNDYTAYYDGSFVSTDPSSFRLPDTTSTDPLGAVSVIKT